MRRLTSIVALVLVLGLVATGCSNKKELEQKDAEITELQSQVSQLQGEVESERQRSEQLNQQLQQATADMQAKENAWMTQRDGMTEITLNGEVTFASGSSRITDQGKDMLSQIWDVLQNYSDRNVLIEGHTDNVPIAEQWQHRYKSNWELSTARALSVLHFVRGKYSLDPDQIGAVGYGEFRPMTTNDTPEGRGMNRRVVITVTPSRSSSGQAIP